MTIVVAGKKLSLKEAMQIVAEPFTQSKRSKKAWEEYLKKTKGKKCKEGLCHNEDDSEDPIATICIVCGEDIAMENWYCYCCKKDFCEDHITNHEQHNGREFEDY